MKLSLQNKLILFILIVLFCMTVFASIIITYELQEYYNVRIFEQLKIQLDQIEFLLSNPKFGLLAEASEYNLLMDYAHTAGTRLTLIDSIGVVVFDSEVSKDSLAFVDNHFSRPEIQMALHHGIGSDRRLSATVDEPMFYAAKMSRQPASSKFFFSPHGVKFIRLAIPLVEVERVLQAVRLKIFIGGGIALLIISFVSYGISRKLTYPIRRIAKVAEEIKKGNLDAHFEHTSQDEIGELADLLNEMLEKLKEDLIKMRKLERMRSQFLGNVSHELRTPIFAVQGYLETMMQDKADLKTQKEFIQKAYHQAVRLNNLLTDLIDISRIESGEMKMTFHDINVHKWLAKLVSELRQTAQENVVTLTLFNRSAENNVVVFGDQVRLNQVIINLAENAIKYNLPFGKVEIGYYDQDNQVEIFVSDTGRGISKEHISRIFERFYRVDKERSRSVGGTGLGLAIVKHIVEAHGSRIRVESEVDKGSTFSFYLQKNIHKNISK